MIGQKINEFWSILSRPHVSEWVSDHVYNQSGSFIMEVLVWVSRGSIENLVLIIKSTIYFTVLNIMQMSKKYNMAAIIQAFFVEYI